MKTPRACSLPPSFLPRRVRITARGLGVALTALVAFLLVPRAFPLVAQPSCYTPAQALAHVGEQACVEGTVTNALYAARSNGRPTFLDFGSDFTAVIWQEDRPKFNPPPETLRGRRLRVSGRIESYRGKAQIIVRDPSQLASADAPLIPPPPTSPSTPAAVIPSPTTIPARVPTVSVPPLHPPQAVVVTTSGSPVIDSRSQGGAARAATPAGTVTHGTNGRSGVIWPLVAVGASLIGAGMAGVAWYRFRQSRGA